MCQFPPFDTFHYIFNDLITSKQPIIMFNYIFRMSLCASSLSIYISLYLQCPILGKFPIYLHFIISLVSRFGQVPYLFTFHQIFSVPFWASSLSIYVSLFIQCPIMCKFTIFLRFIIYLVSHSGQVPYSSTFHQICSVPFWASTLQLYVSLFLQCPIMCKFTIFLRFIIYLVSHYMQVPYHFMFHYIFSVPLCASSLLLLHFIIFLMVSLLASTLSLRLIISFACHYVQVHYLFTFHYIFSVPLCACSISFYLSLYLQCLIMCKFPTFVTFHYIFNGLNTSKYPIITFNYIFRMSLCASSLSIYISLYLQCPILGKFPIYLHFIISLVSRFGQVPYLFTFHQIFSVPFWASSLSIYISLYLQCPVLGKFPIYLHSIRSSVSHYMHVPYLFTFHYIFSFPLWASTPQLYISLFLQCPIMCMFPIFLHFIIYLVSHCVRVPYHFMFHYMFSVPLCASSPSFYNPLYLQCPILGKYPIALRFIISSVFHYVHVPYLFTFHYIFSVPLCASTLSFYVSLYLQCPIMCNTLLLLHFIIFLMVSLLASTLSLRLIISFACHYVQVPYLFTFHYIFSVPFWESSLSIYVSLFLQCPIMCKFTIFLRFIIYLVSHYVQVPYHFMFHYIFSVPLCASSLLLLHFIIFLMVSLLASTLSLRLIISFAYHYVQVPYLFTFHQIFSVPLCACSISFYLSLYLQSPIMCKFPTFVTFHYIFNGLNTSKYPMITFNYIFRMSLCASSLSIYISLDLQCPIMCKFSIFFHFIISVVSHFGQVPYLFTFHQIFSVPFWASSLSIYISLYLQCPISGKFPIYLHSIGSSVSHYVHVPYLFTFHYIFSFPLCASSLTSYVSLYLQCPILGKYPIVLRFIISSVSHYVQVPYLFTFHYFLCVPLCASSPSYLSLYVQCPIMCKFSIFLHSIISLVSHFGQVPYLFTFHQIFSVPFWASSLLLLHFIIFLMVSLLASTLSLRLIISFACHYVQVPYLFTLHYIFSVPFWASSLSIYIPLDLQCPILGKFPIYLHFIISLVSHSGQVPHSFTFHYFFSVPLCACSLSFYISLYIQCPIVCEYPIILCFIICSVSHYVQVLHLFTIHYIFSVPFWASTLQLYVSLFFQCPISACSLSFYISLYIQCPIMCKYPIILCFIISSVSHYVQVPYFCYISLYF